MTRVIDTASRASAYLRSIATSNAARINPGWMTIHTHLPPEVEVNVSSPYSFTKNRGLI